MATETAASNPAKRADIVKRSFRPLTATELDTACVLADDLWYRIISVYPQVSVSLTLEAEQEPLPEELPYKNSVVSVIVGAVLRVVNNPEGVFEEEGDDYRYRRDSAVSTGALYLTEEEIASIIPNLATGVGAFTIKPANSATPPPTAPEEWFWDPVW